MRGLDWPGLMRAGLHGLALRPAEFWALTPAELMLMLGRDQAASGAFTRARLDALLARFPDAPAGQTKGAGHGDDGRVEHATGGSGGPDGRGNRDGGQL